MSLTLFYQHPGKYVAKHLFTCIIPGSDVPQEGLNFSGLLYVALMDAAIALSSRISQAYNKA